MVTPLCVRSVRTHFNDKLPRPPQGNSGRPFPEQTTRLRKSEGAHPVLLRCRNPSLARGPEPRSPFCNHCPSTGPVLSRPTSPGPTLLLQDFLSLPTPLKLLPNPKICQTVTLFLPNPRSLVSPSFSQYRDYKPKTRESIYHLNVFPFVKVRAKSLDLLVSPGGPPPQIIRRYLHPSPGTLSRSGVGWSLFLRHWRPLTRRTLPPTLR